MSKITESIKDQHSKEQASLAVELYQYERRIKDINNRLRELEVILGTANAIEDAEESENSSEAEDV